MLSVRHFRRLGERFDGWADLIEGAAKKEAAVTDRFGERFTSRDLPGVRVEFCYLRSTWRKDSRKYYLITGPKGSSVAVYIGGAGNDLYIAWDAYMRTVWRWGLIIFSIVTFTWPAFIVLGLLKGNPFYYFIAILDEYDADDVTTMVLATHKSLLQAVDDALGVDISQLRMKLEFRAGHRDRVI